LDAVRNAMIGSNWGRGVINQNIGRIRRMFKWAVAKELIPPSVHQGLTAVAGLRAGRSAAKETEPVRPVADEVVEATLPHLSTVVAAMVRVQRLTGARPGEVCMMRTADIDTSGPTWTYSPATHKTVHHGHQRSIPVGPKAQDVLRPFLKPLNPPAFIFSPKDADAERRERQHAERKTPLHYGNAPGTNRKRHPKKAPLDYWDVSSYRRAIARACQAAGVEHWHPHQLRHSAATEIRRHFGVEAAATILGHRNVSITELYAEKNAQAGRDIAQAIG
jgi:integrase